MGAAATVAAMAVSSTTTVVYLLVGNQLFIPAHIETDAERCRKLQKGKMGEVGKCRQKPLKPVGSCFFVGTHVVHLGREWRCGKRKKIDKREPRQSTQGCQEFFLSLMWLQPAREEAKRDNCEVEVTAWQSFDANGSLSRQ